MLMKRLTKLFLTLLCLFAAGVASAATEYEIDQKFSSVAALDGQLFCIVNETDGKAIFNKDNQNLDYQDYATAIAGTAYLWKIHSLATEADAEVQSCYSVEVVKADGSSIGLWGNPAIYLNSGKEGGFDGCFVLGNGSQYGTDVMYGGVWEIEYAEGQGFALKNKARGGYFAGVNPAPTGTDPIYWTFCTLKEKVSADPLATFKDALEVAIAKGKMYSSVAYTDASFGTLTQAITDGEAALIDAAATEASLTGAATAITNAIAALALKDGFTELTAAMFMHWDSATAPTTGSATGCSYELFVPSGLPFGDGNVSYLNFANLAEYSKLYVAYAAGTPRVMMNRDIDNGGYSATEAESHLIEFPKGGWEDRYFTNENNVVTVDLAQILADKGIANLNAIKGANWANVTVTGLYLYKEAAAEITPAYGVIWDAATGAVETAGDYKNIKLDAAYFNNFAQVGDIIRVNFTMPDASRGPLRTVADGQIALLDKNGQTIAEASGIKNDEKPYEFVIDEAMKAKLYDEFVYVRYQNIEVTSIELVQGAVAEEVVTFDFDASNHAASSNTSHDGDITEDEIIVEGGVTMTITPSNASTANRYWGTSPKMRMYGGTMTLVAPEGKAIVKVVYENGKWNANNTINGEVAAEGVWEGNSTNVVLAVAGNTQLKKVVVTLADATDATTTYTPATIANTEETAYTVAEAIQLIDAGVALTDVVFVKGIVTKVDKFQDGAITYWISDDGTTESAQFECYKGKGIDGADFTSIDDVEVGAAVIVTGTMTKYNDIYEFNAGNKLVKYEAPFKPAVADGTYYIYNVATHKYLAAGANWGTHATVNEEGLDFGVALVDGKYTLDSQVSNGGNNHFLNGEWCDGAAYGWTIEKVADDVLTISTGENYLTAGENDVVTLAADGTAAAAQWQFVPAATLEGLRMDALLILMGNATEEAPVDATYLIKAPKFNRNDLRNKAWTETHSGGNANIGKPDADRATYGVEFWNNTFDFNQTLTSLPDGIYEFSIAGYGTNGTTKIYANETEAAFVNTESAANFGAALDAIANGSYTGNTTGKVNVIGGTLKIGIKRTEQVGADWTVFDNAQLTYYGPITDPNAYKELYEEALAAAKDAQGSADYANVTGEEKAALDAAIQQYGNVDETDAAALEAAIKALTEATNAFKDAKAAYDGLAEAQTNVNIDAEAWPYASAEKQGAVEDAMNTTATNAADATAKTEALVKAYRAYIESNAKAEGVEGAGDATDKIVNPKAEEAIAEPWSVVLGEGSGGSLNILSNEPWTDSDGNSAHKYFDGGNWGASAWDVTLVQEVTLPKGQYLLTAKGRAAADVTLTLFAGEETKQMKAIGNAGGDFGRGWNDAWVLFNVTTDEPSTVKIGVQGVTAAQYNWMSFSDFRLTCLSGELTGIETIVNKTDAVEGIYNLNGQKVMKAQKGLYIINGKKVFVK